MNYRQPQMIDALACEYVLGTLRGRARRRFESLLVGDFAFKRAVRAWEQRLLPLADELQPVEPPPRLWADIEKRLDLIPASRPTRVGYWPALAAGLAAAFMLGLFYFLAPAPQPVADYVVVLQDDNDLPQWLVRGYAVPGEATVTAVGVEPAAANQTYELWMLPDDGSPPVSLGLLAGTGITRLALSDEQRAVLAASSILAVSLEPAGGSPTGVPTGPVLFTGAVVRT